MSNDSITLGRIRDVLLLRGVEWDEKRMFGGNCFMVDGKMLLGTFREGLMLRVGPDAAPDLCEQEGAEQMMHGGKPFTGYLRVEPYGYDTDEELDSWVGHCLAFNPLAKASKKKAKKK